MFVPGKPLQPSLVFVSDAGAYPSEAPSRPEALTTNIRLGWKSLPGTNTNLLEKLINYGCKNFITYSPSGQMH